MVATSKRFDAITKVDGQHRRVLAFSLAVDCIFILPLTMSSATEGTPLLGLAVLGMAVDEAAITMEIASEWG